MTKYKIRWKDKGLRDWSNSFKVILLLYITGMWISIISFPNSKDISAIISFVTNVGMLIYIIIYLIASALNGYFYLQKFKEKSA